VNSEKEKQFLLKEWLCCVKIKELKHVTVLQNPTVHTVYELVLRTLDTGYCRTMFSISEIVGFQTYVY